MAIDYEKLCFSYLDYVPQIAAGVSETKGRSDIPDVLEDALDLHNLHKRENRTKDLFLTTVKVQPVSQARVGTSYKSTQSACFVQQFETV